MTSSLWISQSAINKLLWAHYQADLGAHQTDSSWIAQSGLNVVQRLCWNAILGAVCPLWFTVEYWAELLCCLLFVCYFPKQKSQKLEKKKKKFKKSFSVSSLHSMEGICTLRNSCATLPTDATAWGRTTAICIKDCNAALRCSWWPMMFQ